MQFSLKSLFYIMTVACIYLAGGGYFLAAWMTVGKSHQSLNSFQLIDLFALFCFPWAIVGGLIGKRMGNGAEGAALGTVVAMILLLYLLVKPAVH